MKKEELLELLDDPDVCNKIVSIVVKNYSLNGSVRIRLTDSKLSEKDKEFIEKRLINYQTIKDFFKHE